MAGKILSIEVGYATTKVCEMGYQAKKPRVYRYFSVPTPEGILADGLLSVTDDFVATLKKEFANNKIKTKDVIFTISSSKIISREVKIPYCKEAQIGNLVRVNLSDYFPVDVSRYASAYTILETEGVSKEEDSKTKSRPTGYKVLVLAVPTEILDSYRMLATALKLDLKEIDYCGNSVYQAAKESCEEGTQLVVKIDKRSSLLLAQKDGRIVLTRTIPYGIQDTEEEGVEWINNTNQTLMPLVEGISKVVDYYNSNHNDAHIEKIHLTGVGSDIDGICELAENEIGIPVRALKNFTGVNTEKVFGTGKYGEYVGCIGAAIHPVHFATDKEESKGSTSKNGVDPLRLTILLSAGCVLIGVVLILTALFPYLEEKEKQEHYNAIIEQLEPVYQVYLEHQSLSVQTTKMEALDAQTKNRNEEMLDFIAAMEMKMPATFVLNDLASTASGIVMNATVGSKEEVAVVLNELGKLDSFIVATTSAISEMTTEIGEVRYSFAVEMVYAPIVEETEEGEE